jgi:hypothetical protein
MATPKYLLQEVAGQKPFVYLWTPVLAKKADMRPITEKEAKKYQDPDYRPDFPEVEEGKETEEGYVADDGEDNEVLSKLEEAAEADDSQPKPLEVTQQMILAKEVQVVNRKKIKASIEEYLLKKYQMTMLQMEEVGEMKQQAISILETLAASNSLYEKK